MPLTNQRQLFDMPDDVAYFNCAYMSPLLRAARDAGQAAIARKSQPWHIHPGDFFDETEQIRDAFGHLIGADAEGVALIPSVSYGIGVAAANITVTAGQRLLVLEEQFPSNVYAWHDLAASTGATMHTVARPQDDDWTTAIIDQIDAQTAVVAVPHCHWTDGSLVRLEQVAERARAVGAVLVVDATQSLGAYPFDVQAIQPDFLVAGAYKWLLGPYSVGMLYVAPRYRAGRPLEMTWLGREGSEDFSRLVHYRDTFRSGARRYDVGETSNFALLPVALAALEQILAWGVDEIAATLRGVTDQIAEHAEELGYTVAPRIQRAAHMVGLRSAAPLPADLTAQLAAAQVYVSVRGQSIRVSPHVYNTPADIDRLFEVLAALTPAQSVR